MTRLRWAPLWFVGLSVVLSPFFFTLYRLAAFNTVPHDDYTPYLLWLSGVPGGGVPDSPYCYRLLSVAAAWPFYRLMPLIQLTNVPAAMTPAVLKVIAAFAMQSYLAGIAMGMLIFRLGRTEGGLDRGYAAMAAVLAWALCWYTQITAIDSLALMLITLGLCLIRRPMAFALLMLVSVGVNEKIGLFFAIWLVLRCLLGDRRLFARQALAALGSMVVYGGVVATLHLPGNEYQLQPGGYLGTITENLMAYATGRGLLLNILPILVLAGIALPRPQRAGLFARADALVIPALMVVALVLTHLFQAGRIVMHAAPLFVVPAMAALQARFRRASTLEG